MGIQINGQTDTISATDGSLTIDGATVNATGLTGTPDITVGTVNASSAVISGDLTVQGTTTTLDTLLTEVDKLEVGANNTNVAVAITQSGSGDILRLYDSATQVVTVKDGGSVGIGTDNPDATLKVNVASGSNGVVVQNTSTANIALVGARNGDATLQVGQWGSTASGTTFGLSNADLAFIYTTSYNTTHPSALALGTVSNKPIVVATNNTERLRITSTGNVGIGTDNPISELMVENTTQSHITVKTSGSNMAKFGSKGNDVYIGGTAGAANIIFKRNIVSIDHPADSGTETVRIDSSGNVGIGTNNPDRLLHLGSTGAPVIKISDYDTGVPAPSYAEMSFNGGNMVFSADAGNVSGSTRVAFEIDGDEKLRITSSGRVGIGTNNPEQKLDITDGGMYLKNQSSTEGVVFRQPRPELANVQQSNGRGMMDASVSVPASTTVSIARSHWGGIALVGFSGGAQGYRLVSFGYNNTPTVLYSADWQGSLSTTFSTSTYDLRVSHNSGTAKTFWVILIGV